MSSYLLYKTSAAYSFFNDYASTRQFIESDTLISDTLPILIAILSILLIGISVAIVILFRKKDKPTLFYISSILFYLILAIYTIVSRSILSSIILNGIDPRIARIVRDFWLIFYILQIILVAFYLIRALGFDVKKFHFGEDLNELRIEDEDSEEYELTTRFDADKARMNAAMRKEELKAFYYENKGIIILILILLFIVIPTSFIARSIISNKKYSMNEVIDLKGFELKITDVYVTKKNYKGDTLFKGDNSYLIVKFNIKNLSDTSRGISLNNLRIESNDNVYNANTTYYESFIDLGKGYTNQQISNESKDFIAVYIVKDDDIKEDIIVRYADKVVVKKNEASAKYYRVVVKPTNLDDNKKTLNIDLNEEFKLNNISVKFVYSNIKDKFTYDVNNKTKYIVNSLGLVLSLQYEYKGDDNYKTIFEFLKNYGTIRYIVDERVYTEAITNITPNDYRGDTIYLSVNERIKDASEISIVFNSRSVEYMYKIK